MLVCFAYVPTPRDDIDSSTFCLRRFVSALCIGVSFFQTAAPDLSAAVAPEFSSAAAAAPDLSAAGVAVAPDLSAAAAPAPEFSAAAAPEFFVVYLFGLNLDPSGRLQ